MSAIGNIGAVTATTGLTGTVPSGNLAAAAVGTVGHRVLAWVGFSAGARQAGADAWTAQAGTSDFHPDPAELARGGDIYGLRDLAGEIASGTGAGPVDQGSIHRALEDLTRATVIRLAGLSGADGTAQTAALADAMTIAGTDAPSTPDAVIDRLEAATASLSAPAARGSGTS